MTNEELHQLIENYQPSEQTAGAMQTVSLVGLVGPSATGKTTIMETLARSDPGFHYVVGETSRKPRDNEQNGVDYFFRYRDEILEELKQGRLIQAIVGPNGDLYCTRAENFSTTATNLFPLVPLGVKQFRALPLKSFETAFVVPASFDLWQTWLAKQAKAGDWTAEKLKGRLAEAKHSFEFALQDKQTRFVLNDTTEKAIRRLQQVAQSQPPDDEATARTTAMDNYRRLLELG